MTARALMSSRCEHCDTPSERQQALTAAVVEAARRLVPVLDRNFYETDPDPEDNAKPEDYRHPWAQELRSALSDLDKEGM